MRERERERENPGTRAYSERLCFVNCVDFFSKNEIGRREKFRDDQIGFKNRFDQFLKRTGSFQTQLAIGAEWAERSTARPETNSAELSCLVLQLAAILFLTVKRGRLESDRNERLVTRLIKPVAIFEPKSVAKNGSGELKSA